MQSAEKLIALDVTQNYMRLFTWNFSTLVHFIQFLQRSTHF